MSAQVHRITTAERLSRWWATPELIYDTDLDSWWIGDFETLGGIRFGDGGGGTGIDVITSMGVVNGDDILFTRSDGSTYNVVGGALDTNITTEDLDFFENRTHELNGFGLGILDSSGPNGAMTWRMQPNTPDFTGGNQAQHFFQVIEDLAGGLGSNLRVGGEGIGMTFLPNSPLYLSTNGIAWDPGTAGQYFGSNGPGAAPGWMSIASSVFRSNLESGFVAGNAPGSYNVLNNPVPAPGWEALSGPRINVYEEDTVAADGTATYRTLPLSAFANKVEKRIRDVPITGSNAVGPLPFIPVGDVQFSVNGETLAPGAIVMSGADNTTLTVDPLVLTEYTIEANDILTADGLAAV